MNVFRPLLAGAAWTAVIFTTASALSVLPASAQKQSDPNLGHFYMARQQVSITDDSPVIINRQGGGAGAPGTGALPAGPMPLPRAGWVPYSQSVPGLSTNLPRTNNGVPPKMAPAAPPRAMKARTGALKVPRATAAVPSGPAPVKSYGSYKTYPQEQQPVGGLATNNSSANVKGSVLHWARAQHKGF